MEVDSSSNRAWLRTPKVFVQVIVVAFAPLPLPHERGRSRLHFCNIVGIDQVS